MLLLLYWLLLFSEPAKGQITRGCPCELICTHYACYMGYNDGSPPQCYGTCPTCMYAQCDGTSPTCIDACERANRYESKIGTSCDVNRGYDHCTSWFPCQGVDIPLENGGSGNCESAVVNNTLAGGSSCTPTCGTNYRLTGDIACRNTTSKSSLQLASCLENNCIAKADLKAWEDMGCLVEFPNSTTVTGLGSISAAPSYSNCLVSCPDHGGDFEVAATCATGHYPVFDSTSCAACAPACGPDDYKALPCSTVVPGQDGACVPCSTRNRRAGNGVTCGRCLEGFFHSVTGAEASNEYCVPCTGCAPDGGAPVGGGGGSGANGDDPPFVDVEVTVEVEGDLPDSVEDVLVRCALLLYLCPPCFSDGAQNFLRFASP